MERKPKDLRSSYRGIQQDKVKYNPPTELPEQTHKSKSRIIPQFDKHGKPLKPTVVKPPVFVKELPEEEKKKRKVFDIGYNRIHLYLPRWIRQQKKEVESARLEGRKAEWVLPITHKELVRRLNLENKRLNRKQETDAIKHIVNVEWATFSLKQVEKMEGKSPLL